MGKIRTWNIVWAFLAQLTISPSIQAGYREDAFKKFVDYMRTSYLASEKIKLNELHKNFLNTTIDKDKKIISLSLGTHYLESNPKLAIQYLTSARQSTDPLDPLFPMISYYLGLAALKQGNPEFALKISSQISEMNIQPSVRKLALVLGIEAAYKLEQFDILHDYFDALASRFSLGRRLEHIARKGVEALEKKGSFEKANELTEDIARNYPNTEGSRWAFQRLNDLSCEKEKTRKYYPSAKYLIQLSRNVTPSNGLENFIVATLDQPIILETREVKTLSPEERAEFFTEARLYKIAVDELENIYLMAKDKNGLNLDRAANALFKLGKLELKLDVPYVASSFLSRHIMKYPNHFLSPRVLEYLGDSLRYAGHPKAAAITYNAALEKKDSPNLRWFYFWMLYRSGEFAQALQILDRENYITVREGDDPIILIYWRARILEKMGQKRESEEIFNSILNHAGNTFYAAMIAARHPELVKDSDEKKTSDEKIHLTLSAKFLEKSSQKEENKSKKNPSIDYLKELIDVGLNELASMHIQTLNWNESTNLNASETISQLAYTIGDYNPGKKYRLSAFKSMQRIPRAYDELLKHQKRNKEDWKIFFPEAYDKIVFPVAKGIKMSPYLILSIMRAESFYNKDANSPVGAYGLMQLMPYTAIKIATLLRDDDFDMLELGRPDINISYGAYYLDRLMRYYSSNPYIAVAAYNAGPKAVNAWVTSCQKCEPDEFVESIPYRETRRYVREVMRNFVNYNRIYVANPDSLPLSSMPHHLPNEEIF